MRKDDLSSLLNTPTVVSLFVFYSVGHMLNTHTAHARLCYLVLRVHM